MVVITLIFLAGLGTVWLATRYDTNACKVELREEKRRAQEKLIVPPTQYKGVFSPKNLEGQVESDKPAESGERPTATQPKQYEGIFDPKNLQGQPNTGAPVEQPKQYEGIFDPKNLKGQTGGKTEEKTDDTPSKQYKGIFDPKNLKAE
jgi:hypothetical protein